MAVLFRGTDRRLALFFGAPKPNPSAVTFRERHMEPDLSTTIVGISWLDSFPSEGAQTSPVQIFWRCSLPTLTSGPVRSRGAGSQQMPSSVTSGMLSEIVFCGMLNRRRRDAT